MTFARTVTVAAALLAAAAAAQAQKMTPGLWEYTTTMKSASGQMEQAMARAQADLAKLPPEQRKMVEQMMANQGAGMGAKPNTVRVCVSKEQAERAEVPDSNEGRCKREALERSGNTVKFRFSCAEPPSKGSGEYTFASDKAYKGTMVVETMVKGKPERMDMQHDAKWIGADCGTLQPRKP